MDAVVEPAVGEHSPLLRPEDGTTANTRTGHTRGAKHRQDSSSSHLLQGKSMFHSKLIGMPLSYFFIGVATSFINTPLTVYMVNELGAEPQIQNTIGVLTTLPWSFKLLYGFLSDWYVCP
jgi:hypothetical protein